MGPDPTPAGRGYHAQVAAAFKDLRLATASLHPARGKVLVSVTPSFAAKWLIPHLPSLTRARPDLELGILATEKVLNFQEDGIDLAIRQGAQPRGAALEVLRLFRHDIIAVCAPQLLGGGPGVLPPAEIARLPRIHDAHDLWPDFLRHHGLRAAPGGGLRVSQTMLAIDAALSAQGVALVGRFLVTRELASGALVNLSAAPMAGRQDFYLLAPRDKLRNPQIRASFDWFASFADPPETDQLR